MTPIPDTYSRWWRLASHVLFLFWMGCAVLVMNRIRGGFLTNYGADLTQPAWLYIVCRGLHGAGKRNFVTSTIGSSPETAALMIFWPESSPKSVNIIGPVEFFRGGLIRLTSSPMQPELEYVMCSTNDVGPG